MRARSSIPSRIFPAGLVSTTLKDKWPKPVKASSRRPVACLLTKSPLNDPMGISIRDQLSVHALRPLLFFAQFFEKLLAGSQFGSTIQLRGFDEVLGFFISE